MREQNSPTHVVSLEYQPTTETRGHGQTIIENRKQLAKRGRDWESRGNWRDLISNNEIEMKTVKAPGQEVEPNLIAPDHEMPKTLHTNSVSLIRTKTATSATEVWPISIKVKNWWRDVILRKLRAENKALSEWEGSDFRRLLGKVALDGEVTETVKRNEDFKLTRELQKYLYKEMLKHYDNL